jgi:hypothetical protein
MQRLEEYCVAHDECPQVDWRAPAREVNEDVVVAGVTRSTACSPTCFGWLT